MSVELANIKQTKEKQLNIPVTEAQVEAVNNAFKEWALDKDFGFTRNDFLRELIFKAIGREDLADK